MRWSAVAGYERIESGAYAIEFVRFGRNVQATLTYRGATVTSTRGSRTRVNGDMRAIAEHHSRPVAECPTIGCRMHSDVTR